MLLENTIKKIVKKNKCTGCGGCYNFCPNDAISMEYNCEGFLIPIINKEKCTLCKNCLKVCPVNNRIDNENFQNPKVLAAWSKDEKIRITSSSGGVFSEIAKWVLKKGGVV